MTAIDTRHLRTAGGSPFPRWAVVEQTNGVHVVPINDWFEHDLGPLACSCGPSLDPSGGLLLIVHSAYDGRENVEEANLGG